MISVHALVRMVILILSCGVVVGIPVVVAAARYGRRQRRLGLWDKNGPLHPTSPSPDETTENLRRLTGDGIRPY